MKTAPRFSSSLRFLFWLVGFAAFACLAFLPPILGNGVKAAALGVVFVAVPMIGIATALVGLLIVVRNWRGTAAWGWWGARIVGQRSRWALSWVRYYVHLLLLYSIHGKHRMRQALQEAGQHADTPSNSETGWEKKD